MNYLVQRLKEPATWAGLAAILPICAQMAAGNASPELIGALAAGIAAVFMRETGGK